MAFFLGLDLGASGLKAVVIDEEARLVASASCELATHNPRAGFFEQNPYDWLDALYNALAQIKTRAPSAFADIKSISISGGAHIGVLCAPRGEPLRPAILWSDQRADETAQALRATNAETISGNRPNATWTLPQLQWLAAHEPASIKNCRELYFAKDWLRAALTQSWSSDAGEAAGSMMWDYKTNTWSPELVRLSGLAPEALPPILPPTQIAGRVSKKAAEKTGLTQDTPVLQGTIDTSVEWLCTAPLTEKSASLKLASAGVLAISSDEAHPAPPISLYPHILPDKFYYAAGMNQCLPALHWVRETLLRAMPLSDMETLAQSAPLGAEGVLFHPYLAGERAPIWRADISASLTGLNRASNRASIARAAYEGVGFALMDIWQDIKTKIPNALPDTFCVIGGGAASAFWCQMLADMLGARLIRGKTRDASFASALLAGVGARAFASISEAAAQGFEKQDEFIPDKQNHSRYGEAHMKFQKGRNLS